MCIFSENERRLTMLTKQGVEFYRIFNASVPGLTMTYPQLWSIRITAVYLRATKLVDAHAHEKWNYFVRIDIKIANFETDGRCTSLILEAKADFTSMNR